MEPNQLLKVIEVENLTNSAYILRFERNNIEFIPGQYICLGPETYAFMREYSIFSSIHDPFLEVLIKEVPDGDISKKLRKLEPGDKLRYKLSLSSFLNSKNTARKKIFIATGTGISPFHSYVKSSGEQIEVLHGVRFEEEKYKSKIFQNYVSCTSGEKSGQFQGRVTDYLRNKGFDIQADYFLCGNGKMIYEVFDILQQGGVKADQVNYEIYF